MTAPAAEEPTTITQIWYGHVGNGHAELNYVAKKGFYVLHLVGRVVYLSEAEVRSIGKAIEEWFGHG